MNVRYGDWMTDAAWDVAMGPIAMATTTAKRATSLAQRWMTGDGDGDGETTYGPDGYEEYGPMPPVGIGPIGTASVPGAQLPRGPVTPAGQMQQIKHWMDTNNASPEQAARKFGVPAAHIRRVFRMGPAPWQIALFALLTVGVPLIVFGGVAVKQRRGRRRRRL